MKAFIPSMKRVHRQTTFNAIQHAIDTYIVVPEDEFKLYESYYPGRVISCPVKGIAGTRDFIIEHCIAEKIGMFIMFDDDITPQIRQRDGKIRNSDPEEIRTAINWLETTLLTYAHASWSPRALDFATEGDEKHPGRMMHCLAYRTSVLEKEGFRCLSGVDADHVQDDFNLTLQLLTAGYENCISLVHRSNPSASNSKGGASSWRTVEIHNKSAKRMAELYPQFVKLREKKNWQGFDGVQYDITVQWKKAYEFGRTKCA